VGVTSRYLQDKQARHILLNQTYTPPAVVYLSCHITSPGVDNTGTEVAGGLGYARQPTTWDFTSFWSAWWLTAPVVFGPSTGAWGTIAHCGVYDAASGGNLLYYGPLYATFPIVASQTLTFPAFQIAFFIRIF